MIATNPGMIATTTTTTTIRVGSWIEPYIFFDDTVFVNDNGDSKNGGGGDNEGPEIGLCTIRVSMVVTH